MTRQFKICFILFFLISGMCSLSFAADQNSLSKFEREVLAIAEQCRDNVIREFTAILADKQLTLNQLFDTFYIPIANTFPQKFHTQYDTLTDERLRTILDECLARDSHFLYAVAADKNGYVPTHNSKYTKTLTNNPEYDAKHNRTKRLFNDRTGLAAAKNTDDFLLQKYARDTGEVFYDLSVPIFIEGKHWGAIRIGFQDKG